jgi:predicted membrane protein (TIGR00267 family)
MLDNFKTYAKITNLWAIARRYFVNNFYDGMLTVLGILLGFFVTIIRGNQSIVNSNLIILACIGSSISMFVSGLSGSYLSERAEQRKMKVELDKAMVKNENEEENLESEIDLDEIEKAMLIKIEKRRRLLKIRSSDPNKKKPKTIQEKAEQFASIIVAIINGSSPFFGGLVPVIPFFFVSTASVIVFINSFIIILFCIVLLGIFLGTIAKESILKNVIQMSLAFLITILISLILLR